MCECVFKPGIAVREQERALNWTTHCWPVRALVLCVYLRVCVRAIAAAYSNWQRGCQTLSFGGPQPKCSSCSCIRDKEEMIMLTGHARTARKAYIIGDLRNVVFVACASKRRSTGGWRPRLLAADSD